MTNDPEIAALFESEDVIVDTWPAQVRKKLDVADPLVRVGVETLAAGQSLVVTGIPGDGKSHLALSIADRYYLVSDTPLALIDSEENLNIDFAQAAGVLLSDASTIDPDLIIEVIDKVRSQGKVALIAVNEGPLQDLANRSDFFGRVRDLSHSRDVNPDDAARVRVIDLFGRQSIHYDLASQALVKILENVTPCPACREQRDCPRVYGANALSESPDAQQRLLQLIRLGSDATYRLTAREVWGILISLFFGQRCPRNIVNEDTFREGLWWNRLYDSVGQAKLDHLIMAIRHMVDPVTIPRSTDADLWRGRGELVDRLPVPQTSPATYYLNDPEQALRAFTSKKRESFFFDSSWDVSGAILDSSRAGEFSQMVDIAIQNRTQEVIARIVEAINEYRSGIREDQELVVSRHNQFNVSRRVSAYITNERIATDELSLDLPYASSVRQFPDSGFRPRELHLSWRTGTATPLVVDLEFWTTVRSRRTIYVDRSQESADYALDLFFAAAPSSARNTNRFEVLIPSSGVRREYRLRTLDDRRSVEMNRS